MEVLVGSVCKTVGLAYDGSNPSPATTCENGPLAGDSRASGPFFSVHGFYGHSLDWLLGPWRETGVIEAPADGRVSWTDRADEAEAAAVILAGDRPYDGPVTLTASAAPTLDEIARIASELTGRDIRRVIAPDDTWVARQVANGTPELMARFTLGIFQAARQGRFADTDPLLGDLLGRKPPTVRDLLAERAAA
jgi:NAD(P)H dehydrogenase (quinone)